MKTKIATLLTLACAACVPSTFAQSTPNARQLQSFQKNLARQHLASNLFLFDSASQRYVATEAAAAWLDDDVSTGWPALAGKQHYLLQFSEPQVVTNFSLSTTPAEGSITIYSGDDIKSPSDTSWRVVAKNVPLASINQKTLAKGFNRQAKYLLIETDIPNPGPVFSLYAFGERSAANDAIVKRPAGINVQAMLGEFVNERTSFNVSSLYAQSRVSYSNGGASSVAWQKAIDDNPETVTTLKPSKDSSLVLGFAESRTVSRISMLGDAGAKGTVDVFLLAEAPGAGHPVSLANVKPSVSLTFDGTNARASADFDDTTAVAMALRWTPISETATFSVRELNTFGNLSLAEYEVAGAPPMIAEGPAENTETTGAEKSTAKSKSTSEGQGDGKEITPIGEGKDTVDYKGGGGKSTKEVMPPILAGPQSGYFPGGLGFPPNVFANRRPPTGVLPPGKKFPSP